MKTTLSWILTICLAILICPSCGTHHRSYSSVPDGSVTIGKQVWMSDNLDVDTFRNGDRIMQVESADEWYMANLNLQPAWCHYENNPENGETYGKLYNWYAVDDPRGLAPKGWHVPNDEEWKELSDHLGGDEESGLRLKGKANWLNGGNGNNRSRFNGFPGGERSSMLSDGPGIYRHMGEYGYWWSSSRKDNEYTTLVGYVALSFDYGGLYRNLTSPGHGLSVRCIRD